jgi:hypothetical protein
MIDEQLRIRVTLGVVIAVGCVGLAVPRAQVPSAETIIDKHVEATGGRARLHEIRTVVLAGTVELVGKGVKGTFRSYRAAPSSMFTVSDLPGIGVFEDGSNGQVAWSRSSIGPPRLKEGEEKSIALRDAAFNLDLRWQEFFASAEVAGTENVNGQPCYRVVLTPKGGTPVMRFYSQKTGLLVGGRISFKTPQGDLVFGNLTGDYRPVGGVLTPHRVEQKIPGQDFVVLLESVTYNAIIPPDRFQIPPDVQALIDRTK